MSTVANLNQENGLPLECQIKTQSEYQLGKGITVTGVIHNAGASAIWISPRNTFLEKEWRDCLSVTHDGSPVAYIGMGVTQMFPDAESFVRIPAGESVEGQIDLSENYAITGAGNYEASFDLRIVGAFEERAAEPPQQPHQLKLTVVASNKATFRVEGSAATQTREAVKPVSLTAPKPLASFAPTPKAPTFEGMTKEEEQEIFWAHQEAYKYILAALADVQKSIDTQLYNDWFERKWIWGRKSGWEERRKTVIQNFTNMANWMATSALYYWKTDVGCKFDTLGMTVPNARAAIRLCPLAFNVHFMRFYYWRELKWMQIFTLIHEISHAACNTTDHMYYWTICYQLPSFDPGEAVKNAQNYALFAMGQLGAPGFSPLETLELKTGDKICLRADNGQYLSRIDHPAWGNYIQALKAHIDPFCVFTVTVPDADDKKLLLQADNQWYYSWNDNGGYIMANKQTPDEACYFTPGEFTDQNNKIYLVLMAKNGQILSRIDPGSYIMAVKNSLDPCCLFLVEWQKQK
jgi:hypothetical protein